MGNNKLKCKNTNKRNTKTARNSKFGSTRKSKYGCPGNTNEYGQKMLHCSFPEINTHLKS